MPPKHQLIFERELLTRTYSPHQPSAPAAELSSPANEHGSNTSSALTRTSRGFPKRLSGLCSRRQIVMSSPTPFSYLLQSGGRLTGTWQYHPQEAAVPAPSSTLAITPAEEAAAREPSTGEAAAQDFAEADSTTADGEHHAAVPLANLQPPLNSVCSSCDQEAENMQRYPDVGNVCPQCVSRNARVF